MTCYHPLRAYKSPGGGVTFTASKSFGSGAVLTLPCGQCIGCRLERSRQWAMRCMHEAKLYEDNCFITLTYAPAATPAHNSLVVEDFQLFMKRLRKKFSGTTIRYYCAGEYGDKFDRPHYHACLFNLQFYDKSPLRRSPSGEMLFRSPTLEALWPQGYSSIGECNYKSAAYCARYIVGKSTGPEAIRYQEGYCDPSTGEVFGPRVPPFNIMSRRPGIGRDFALKFASDIFPSDYMILDGRKVQPPRYYDKVLLEEAPLLRVKSRRKAAARLHKEDQTPDRLKVREIVRKAQLTYLKRSLVE